jgi:hypothetical protein
VFLRECRAFAFVQNCGSHVHGTFRLRPLVLEQESHLAKNIKTLRVESADARAWVSFCAVDNQRG